jgi:FixJ family two-component response regulator
MNTKFAVIAIVDDDDAVRRALHRLLSSYSFESVSFASGEAFLADISRVAPHCVLLDQHMPGMTGLEILLRMKAEDKKVPTIIITGYDQPGLRKKCLEAGAADYLLKPVSAKSVLTAIRLATVA